MRPEEDKWLVWIEKAGSNFTAVIVCCYNPQSRSLHNALFPYANFVNFREWNYQRSFKHIFYWHWSGVCRKIVIILSPSTNHSSRELHLGYLGEQMQGVKCLAQGPSMGQMRAEEDMGAAQLSPTFWYSSQRIQASNLQITGLLSNESLKKVLMTWVIFGASPFEENSSSWWTVSNRNWQCFIQIYRYWV